MLTTDHDLLRWEPNLGHDALALGVTKLEAFCTLDGHDLLVPSGGLRASVAPGELVQLDGDARACLPILSVESDTRCVVRRESGWPGETGIHRPTRDRIDRLRARFFTFEPLRRLAEAALPEVPTGEFNRTRAASLASLHLIYAALHAPREHEAALVVRRELYLMLLRRALRSHKHHPNREECA